MTKTINDLNLYQWFTKRELHYAPPHFITSKTPTNPESYRWIREKLTGRYCIVGANGGMFDRKFPSFEDPKEALFYELTWS